MRDAFDAIDEELLDNHVCFRLNTVDGSVASNLITQARISDSTNQPDLEPDELLLVFDLRLPETWIGTVPPELLFDNPFELSRKAQSDKITALTEIGLDEDEIGIFNDTVIHGKDLLPPLAHIYLHNRTRWDQLFSEGVPVTFIGEVK